MSRDIPKDFERTLGNEDRLRQARTIASDEAFVARMKAMIALGKEHVRFGIVVDDTPHAIGFRFFPEPRFSGCGSPAASCAERGESGVNGVGEVRYA